MHWKRWMSNQQALADSGRPWTPYLTCSALSKAISQKLAFLKIQINWAAKQCLPHNTQKFKLDFADSPKYHTFQMAENLATPKFKGSCLCGKVTFEINSEPIAWVPAVCCGFSYSPYSHQRNLLPLFELQKVYRDSLYHECRFPDKGRLMNLLTVPRTPMTEKRRNRANASLAAKMLSKPTSMTHKTLEIAYLDIFVPIAHLPFSTRTVIWGRLFRFFIAHWMVFNTDLQR